MILPSTDRPMSDVRLTGTNTKCLQSLLITKNLLYFNFDHDLPTHGARLLRNTVEDFIRRRETPYGLRVKGSEGTSILPLFYPTPRRFDTETSKTNRLKLHLQSSYFFVPEKDRFPWRLLRRPTLVVPTRAFSVWCVESVTRPTLGGGGCSRHTMGFRHYLQKRVIWSIYPSRRTGRAQDTIGPY